MKRFLTLWTSVRSDILLLWNCLFDKHIDRKIKALIIMMVVYVIAPLDIFSDWIPLLGQVDDVVVIVTIVAWIKRNIPPKIMDELKGKVIEGK